MIKVTTKNYQLIDDFKISEVITLNVKSLTGTETKLTCKVLGLTRKLDYLGWTTSRGAHITNNLLGYSTDAQGFFNGASQTTTLKIAAEQNDGSTSYNCVVVFHEHGGYFKEMSTAVIFKGNIGLNLKTLLQFVVLCKIWRLLRLINQ